MTKGKYYLTLLEFLNLIQRHVDIGDFKLIKKAYYLSRKAHFSQTRDEGTPYFDHPLRVAEILVTEVRLNLSPEQRKFTLEELICIALMHDVLEETNIGYADLAARFGDKIAMGVQELTKLEKSMFPFEDIKKIYLRNIMEGGKELVLIKLCDRLDNLRFVKNSSFQKIISYAEETGKYFLPLAKTYNEYMYEQFIALLKQLHKLIKKDIRTGIS